MTDLELAGVILPAEADAPVDVQLQRLTAAWIHRQRSEHTKVAYHRDFAYWVDWCDRCGVSPLQARMMHMDAWIAYQRQYGVRGEGKPAAEASIARRVAVASSWYRYVIKNTAADDAPLITHNPADTDARPRIDQDYSPTVGLTTAEADRLIRAADADSPRTSALIRLMLTNALRCDSVIRLGIEDIGYDRGHRVLHPVGKGNKKGRQPLPPATGAAIDRMLAERGNPTAGPLLVTKKGKQLDEPYLFRLVRRLALAAGLPQAEDLSPHSLRHTAITETLEQAGMRAAQDLADHADPRTTRRYDRRRNSLDGHAAYLLAGRYGADPESTSTPPA